jgi:hypothetical protein
MAFEAFRPPAVTVTVPAATMIPDQVSVPVGPGRLLPENDHPVT